MINGMDFHLGCEVFVRGQSPRQLRLTRPVGSQVYQNCDDVPGLPTLGRT
jgi:hypothetical protein